MTYNSNDKTIETAKELEKEFNNASRVIALKCVVSDSQQVKEVVDKCMKEFGRIDVFVSRHALPFPCCREREV